MSETQSHPCLYLWVLPEVSEIHITVIVIPVLYWNEVHQTSQQRTMKKMLEFSDYFCWPAFSKSVISTGCLHHFLSLA
jgi:hypothetical protein